MNPPSQWICDFCDGTISVENGKVQYDFSDGLRHSFMVVHKDLARCDPRGGSGDGDLDIDRLVGWAGLTRLLGWLSAGPLKGGGSSGVKFMDEFVELVRRLHIPYYEEARRHFSNEGVQSEFASFNEYEPYVPDVLQQIARGVYDQ